MLVSKKWPRTQLRALPTALFSPLEPLRPPGKSLPEAGFSACHQVGETPSGVGARLLKPLGNPPANGVKCFATDEILELSKEKAWLGKMANAMYKNWQDRNARYRTVSSETLENVESGIAAWQPKVVLANRKKPGHNSGLLQQHCVFRWVTTPNDFRLTYRGLGSHVGSFVALAFGSGCDGQPFVSARRH